MGTADSFSRLCLVSLGLYPVYTAPFDGRLDAIASNARMSLQALSRFLSGFKYRSMNAVQAIAPRTASHRANIKPRQRAEALSSPNERAKRDAPTTREAANAKPTAAINPIKIPIQWAVLPFRLCSGLNLRGASSGSVSHLRFTRKTTLTVDNSKSASVICVTWAVYIAFTQAKILGIRYSA